MSSKLRVSSPPSDNVALKHIIEAAKRGNQRAARALLAEFVYWADVGEAPEPLLMSYIADAFFSIIRHNEMPSKALRLPPRRGRPERTFEEQAQDLALGWSALSLVRAEGMTYEEAIARVAEAANASPRKVEREYRRMRELLDVRARELDPDDKHDLREFHPEISKEKLEREVRLRNIVQSVQESMEREGKSEEEAGTLVAENEAIPEGEVREALCWYHNWLMNL